MYEIMSQVNYRMLIVANGSHMCTYVCLCCCDAIMRVYTSVFVQNIHLNDRIFFKFNFEFIC